MNKATINGFLDVRLEKAVWQDIFRDLMLRIIYPINLTESKLVWDSNL